MHRKLAATSDGGAQSERTAQDLPPAQQQQAPSLLSQLSSSVALGPGMYTVTGWTFCALCMVATVASLASFAQLQEQIGLASAANGFTGPAADLQILDLRNGYSPQEVADLLGAWGPVGRRLYLVGRRMHACAPVAMQRTHTACMCLMISAAASAGPGAIKCIGRCRAGRFDALARS